MLTILGGSQWEMPQTQPTFLGWRIVTLVGMWRAGAQTTPGVGRAASREKLGWGAGERWPEQTGVAALWVGEQESGWSLPP